MSAKELTTEELLEIVKKKKPMSMGDKAMGLLNNALQGITFGFADELTNVADRIGRSWQSDENGEDWTTPEGGTSGTDALALANRFKEEHPVLGYGAEIAGGLLTGGMGAAKVAGTQAFKQAPRLLKYGLLGAGEGAIAGAGYAPEGETAQGALTGALFGGAVGTAAPLAGKTIAGLWNRGARQIAGAPKSITDKMIRKALEDDGISVFDAQARLRANPNLTLADVGGRNTKALLKTAVRRPGEARNTVNTALNARQEGQMGRLEKMFNETIDNRDFNALKTTVDKAQREAAAPLYQLADNIDVPISGDLASLTANKRFSTEILKPAFNRASRQDMTPNDLNKLKFWDTVKREIDNKIGKATRAGANEDVRDFTRWKNRLVSYLDDISDKADGEAKGAYQKARQAWAGEEANKAAMDMGDKFLRSKKGIEWKDMLNTFKTMTPGEQQYFRVGVRNAIQDSMENQPVTGNAIRKFFDSPANKRKLTAMMPNREARERLIQELADESDMYSTRAVVQGGSDTAENLFNREFLDEATNIAGDIASGNTAGLVRQAIALASKKMGKLPEKVVNEIAEALTSGDAATQQALFQRLVDPSAIPKGFDPSMVSATLAGLLSQGAAAARVR